MYGPPSFLLRTLKPSSHISLSVSNLRPSFLSLIFINFFPFQQRVGYRIVLAGPFNNSQRFRGFPRGTAPSRGPTQTLEWPNPFVAFTEPENVAYLFAGFPKPCGTKCLVEGRHLAAQPRPISWISFSRGRSLHPGKLSNKNQLEFEFPVGKERIFFGVFGSKLRSSICFEGSRVVLLELQLLQGKDRIFPLLFI